MKMKIGWHEECLANRRNSLDREIKDLEKLKASIERSRQEVALYEDQIRLAKKRGVDGFDQDRFGIKRK